MPSLTLSTVEEACAKASVVAVIAAPMLAVMNCANAPSDWAPICEGRAVPMEDSWSACAASLRAWARSCSGSTS